jgi:RNA polymerase sigma factor (TIGR02999 family)
MDKSVSQDITQLLVKWKSGDKEALDSLIPFVYKELKKIASKYLSEERANHTLQTTALVNEAYIRLIKIESIDWQNRAHFFGIASQLMRHILVDYARKRLADKRFNASNKISLQDIPDQIEFKDLDIIALDDALSDFAKIDPEQSRLVELRFFGGLTIEETAEAMQLSPKIVRRKWEIAKMWLAKALERPKS